MTMIYFVRHCQSNYNNHDDERRELTDQGLLDRALVNQYLMGKDINVVLSSPYKRSFDTVKEFADLHGLLVKPFLTLDNVKLIAFGSMTLLLSQNSNGLTLITNDWMVKHYVKCSIETLKHWNKYWLNIQIKTSLSAVTGQR